MTTTIKLQGYLGMKLHYNEGIGMENSLCLFDEKEFKMDSEQSLIKFKEPKFLYDIYAKYIEPNILKSSSFKLSLVVADLKSDITPSYIEENKKMFELDSIYLDIESSNSPIQNKLIILDDIEYDIYSSFTPFVNKYILFNLEII